MAAGTKVVRRGNIRIWRFSAVSAGACETIAAILVNKYLKNPKHGRGNDEEFTGKLAIFGKAPIDHKVIRGRVIVWRDYLYIYSLYSGVMTIFLDIPYLFCYYINIFNTVPDLYENAINGVKKPP
ncbi:hypothetical protein [Sneathiella sp.]|uniref:hypothetical protein n=1 Tax=Sneathiella sp. TaxID=1964365 RepID=UPI0025D22EA6|nr:hypothetical protein [Sneathiella sp.]